MSDEPAPLWFVAEHRLWARLERRLLGGLPMGGGQLVRNLRLFDVPSTVARTLWFDELYRMILNVPGSIHLCGVLWGGDLILWDNLRQLHEPGLQGTLRGLVGFDTFAGHAGSSETDGPDPLVAEGAFAVPEGYEDWLMDLVVERGWWLRSCGLLELVKGDIRDTYGEWFVAHPWEQVALVYLDLDLYAPTKAVLEVVWDRLPVGAVVAFDEYGNQKYQGETVAVREVLGNVEIRQPVVSAAGWAYTVKT